MTKPIISLISSTPEALLESYHAASRAVDKAHEALLNIPIHPREYGGGEAWKDAHAERSAFLSQLRTMKDELDAVAEHLAGFTP